MSETDNRTATQRIEDLEKVVTVLYQAVSQNKAVLENLLKSQGDMNLVKDALRLLNKKVEAVIQAANEESGISAASVSNLLTKMNVDDLIAQVAGFVANGHLAVTDTVAADSFLVCEEYDADGALVNPRIQFRMDSQEADTTTALTGKKVGDAVSFGEKKFSAKILEIYTLTEPKAETAAAEVPAEAPTAVAEAPTSEAKEPEATAGYTPPAFAGPDTTPTEAPVPTFVTDAGTVTTPDTATA